MIGRQRELAELEQLFGTACEGRPSMVLVEGPAGIGKTTLLERFLAHRRGVRTCRAGTVPWESSLPFGVVEQLMRGSEDPTSLPRPAERTLRKRDPVDVGVDLLELWSPSREGEPVVVAVEDAHWADIESLQALSSAFRRTTHEKVLIVLAAEPSLGEGAGERVHEFLAGYRVPRVRVAPLTPVEVQDLAIRSVGVDLTMPAAQRLAEHTHGNPLYIEQLLCEVPAESWREWQPILPAPRALATGVVSALHTCSPQARALVESAAALGQRIAFAEAAELAGIDDEPVAALDEASSAGLLNLGDEGGMTVLAFPDPMVHAAVHADLSPLNRQELHRRAAEIVDDEGARLMHLVAAAPFPDADLAEKLDAFAVRQAMLGAWFAAGNALINASRLSPDRADREHRLVRAVDALVGAGDLPRALAFSPVIESFPAGALRDAVLGYLAILLGRQGEAELLLTRAWQQCTPRRDPDTAALICQRRVLHSMSRWHGPDLVDWGRRAVELVDPEDPSAVESEAIMGLGLAADGRIPDARNAYREVSAKVTAGAQSQRVHMGKGWLDLALDDPQTARRELEGAVPTRYRQGSTRISLWAQAWLARTEFALGSWEDALHTVDRAVAQLDHAGLELARPLVHWTGAQIHALRGNWEIAQEHLQRGAATVHNYAIMLIPGHLAWAQYSEAQADYETVIRSLEPLVQLQPRRGIDEPGFWPWHDVYANALVMVNRIEEADAFLAPHEALAVERGHRSTRARLGYVRGRIAGSAGDLESARASFESALTRLAGLPLPYERARVNFAYGQTLRRAGKRREADVALQSARESYVTLGAQVYVERCDRELKAGGVKLGGVKTPSATSRIGSLTAQEQAVAELVAGGMSNKQAAAELFVSVKTVQYHLTRIYGKLGIRSRGELAARFRGGSGGDRA